MEGKRKFIEDAARVIDGRVAALEAELQCDVARGSTANLGSDRAAIMEAKHLARLIRSLKIGPYLDPYKAASERWNRGRANDDSNREPSPRSAPND